MNTKQLLLGVVTAGFVFGAYFAGLFQGQKKSIRWRDFFANMTRPLTWTGFAWSVSLPAVWIFLYYTFVVHVWLSLGRWPAFGEQLRGWPLAVHAIAIRPLWAALLCSLYITPLILSVCLFLQRWRHVALYALCYGAAAGIACGSLFCAPHPFLNWLFD